MKKAFAHAKAFFVMDCQMVMPLMIFLSTFALL